MARSETTSDFREIRKFALEHKWRVDRTMSGHWKFVPPRGRPVIFSGSPSDNRSWMNFIASLRRGGLNYKRR